MSLWVRGAPGVDRQPTVSLYDARDQELMVARLADYLDAGRVLSDTWQRAMIPLVDLRAVGVRLSRINVQNYSYDSLQALHLDDVRLLGSGDVSLPAIVGLAAVVHGD